METTKRQLSNSQDKHFPNDLNAPHELKKCILDTNAEKIIKEIAENHRLKSMEVSIYARLCLDYLFSFRKNTTGFIQKLESKSGFTHEKANLLAQAFKEKIIERVIKLLKDHNLNIEGDNENLFFKYKNLKVTDRYIYYSEYKQRQPIINVSNIVLHKKFLSPSYILYFEVFIPKEGSWGNIDRPSFVIAKEDAKKSADKLEKAISMGEFRLMYENIMSYY